MQFAFIQLVYSIHKFMVNLFDWCLRVEQTNDYLCQYQSPSTQIQTMHATVYLLPCHGVLYCRPAWNAHYHRIQSMRKQPMAHGKLSTAPDSSFSCFRHIMIGAVANWFVLLVQRRHADRRKCVAVSGIHTEMQRIKDIDRHRWWLVSRYVNANTFYAWASAFEIRVTAFYDNGIIELSQCD